MMVKFLAQQTTRAFGGVWTHHLVVRSLKLSIIKKHMYFYFYNTIADFTKAAFLVPNELKRFVSKHFV